MGAGIIATTLNPEEEKSSDEKGRHLPSNSRWKSNNLGVLWGQLSLLSSTRCFFGFNFLHHALNGARPFDVMLAAPRAVFFGAVGFFSLGFAQFVPRRFGQIARGFAFANRDFAIGGRPFLVRPLNETFL